MVDTTTETLLPVAGPAPLTPEWYEAHRTHITATDIAPILGRSDYKTAFDVFCEKTGKIAPFEGNAHTRRGQRYERAILSDYAEATESAVAVGLPLFFHPTLPFLAATPDAANEGPDVGGSVHAFGRFGGFGQFGVEAKFSMSPARAAALGDEQTDEIPDDWLLQVQAQMAVMGWKRDDLAALIYGRLRVYSAARDETLVGIIESAAKEMYERIQADDPPEPDWCHPQTPELIKSLYGLREGVVAELPQECEAFYAAYQDLGADIKMLEHDRQAARARLLHAMGEAEIGRLPGLNMEVVRSTVNRAGYTVKPTSFIQFRARKVKA